MALSDLPSNCQASFFLPSTVSHYSHFILTLQLSVQRQLPISRDTQLQEKHWNTGKALEHWKYWNVLPRNSGIRVTQVRLIFGSGVFGVLTHQHSRLWKGPFCRDETDLRPTCWQKVPYQHHMGTLKRSAVSISEGFNKCKSGASKNPHWESTVVFKHVCTTQRAYSVLVCLTIVRLVLTSCLTSLHRR